VSSRAAILAALRDNAPAPAPLPELPQGLRYPDPVGQFLDMVSAVGGAAQRVTDTAALNAGLRALPVWAEAKQALSLVAGVGDSTVNTEALSDPHQLEGLDVAVLPGDLGVAENGAVWVRGSKMGRHRVALVIAEHLVLVVCAADIVSNMHEAYDVIELERPGYGVFVAGPSKTADIEQALVIGAHGARSCTVFVVGCA